MRLPYRPRGIGKNSLPCFFCGKADGVQDDMAAFVDGKLTGEAVVQLFEDYGMVAKLDYRPTEPDWVQVKIGACSDHSPLLCHLEVMTALTGDICAVDLERLRRIALQQTRTAA